MKKNDVIYSWDEEAGVASCILNDGRFICTGIAICDAEDFDMKSEKTGCQIAFFRAEIDYYKHLRDYEIKPVLDALKHLQSTIILSKNYNKDGYVEKRIQNSISQQENDLKCIKQLIKSRRAELKEYLNNKENFYKQIRKHRNKDKDN